MKTILKTTLLVFLIISLWSCEKEETFDLNNPTYITIKNTDNFTQDFKISGDEEGAIIKLQATHFVISEIVRNESTGWSVVYQYKPESGFIGTDSVRIETYTGSDGSSIGKTDLVKLFFRITE